MFNVSSDSNSSPQISEDEQDIQSVCSDVDDLDYESHEDDLDPLEMKKPAPTPKKLLEKKEEEQSMTSL